MLVEIGIIVTLCLSLLPYLVNAVRFCGSVLRLGFAARLIVDADGYKINVSIMV